MIDKRDRTGLSRLGLFKIDAALSAAEGVLDGYGSLRLIEIRPLQGADLTSAHTGNEHDLNGDRKRSGLRFVHELKHTAPLFSA